MRRGITLTQTRLFLNSFQLSNTYSKSQFSVINLGLNLFKVNSKDRTVSLLLTMNTLFDTVIHCFYNDFEHLCARIVLLLGTDFVFQNILEFDKINSRCQICKMHCTKMKFSIKDFFSKCDQIRSFLMCNNYVWF